MSYQIINASDGSFRTLRQLAQRSAAVEQCDFCNARLPATHRHLLEVVHHKIVCACDACAVRFQDVVGGRFKLIPRDARILPDFQITDAQWESLALPINLAFFFRNSLSEKTIAIYPSPAGPMESLLPLENWRELVAQNPGLQELEPDVEALLVNRVRSVRDYFIVPMDACFELVGAIRMHWRGLSGGEEVWREIDKFFGRLKASVAAFEHTEELSRA